METCIENPGAKPSSELLKSTWVFAGKFKKNQATKPSLKPYLKSGYWFRVARILETETFKGNEKRNQFFYEWGL